MGSKAAGGMKAARKRGWGESAAVVGMFNAAVGHHREGRLDEAEELYREVLARDDRHAESLHFLGMIAFKRGQHAEAEEKIRAAIASDARQASYHSNLGNVLRADGRYDAAAEAFRTMVAELVRGVGRTAGNAGKRGWWSWRLESAILAKSNSVNYIIANRQQRRRYARIGLDGGATKNMWLPSSGSRVGHRLSVCSTRFPCFSCRPLRVLRA